MMLIRRNAVLLCSTVLTMIAPPAMGQAVSTASDAQSGDVAPAEDGTVGDIVVTARRKSESLQDVPQAVTAVSGDTIGKLAITQFQDVAALVPGLSLGNSSQVSGGSPAPSLRGVSYDSAASNSPTVDVYLNEVPSDPSFVYSAVYDMSDVQVLRGPQGTLRGRTAPSGAILMSTRRPDAGEWGGYVNMLGTDKGSVNAQAAFNAPIVRDLLALRVAGVVDENEGNFVESANTGRSPYVRTLGGRASLGFKPASNFDATLIYQYLKLRSAQFVQVEGRGSPGGTISTAPAGYNGPVVSAADRLAVDDTPSYRGRDIHQVTALLDWRILGQRLSYVGGFNHSDASNNSATDFGNLLPGNTLSQNLATKSHAWTHEIRLASDGSDNVVDYTVGFFHSKSDATVRGSQPGALLPGTFGSPLDLANPRVLNRAYILPIILDLSSKTVENSFFGSVTVHLGPRTEITGGGRYIISKVSNLSLIRLGAGQIAAPAPVPCGVLGVTGTFPGTCDFTVPASTTPIQNVTQGDTLRPFVYNASLSHRFSEAVLAYATVASSWRRGGQNLTINNGGNDPVLAGLAVLPPEKSTSFEVGIKTNLLDRRLRFNAAVFYQKFKGLLFQTAPIPYVNNNGATIAVETNGFNVAADAIVKGFDVDLAFQATPNWSISGGISYADGKIDNDVIPCRDSNFDGTPDAGTATLAQFQAANRAVATCRGKGSVSREPLWTATVQTEVLYPLESSELYLRGLSTIYDRNTRRDIGLTVPLHTIVNLYAGLRSNDGAWDVGLFARNLTNTGVTTSRDTSNIITNGNLSSTFGDTGYRFADYTPPRQIGVNVRYAFGGR